MSALNRCLKTGNPCGTDTWTAGHACECEPCQHYLRVEASKKKLGSVIVDDISARVMERKAKGRLEAEALSILLTCKRDGHSRNPDGKCVRCHDVSEEPGYEST